MGPLTLSTRFIYVDLQKNFIFGYITSREGIKHLFVLKENKWIAPSILQSNVNSVIVKDKHCKHLTQSSQSGPLQPSPASDTRESTPGRIFSIQSVSITFGAPGWHDRGHRDRIFPTQLYTTVYAGMILHAGDLYGPPKPNLHSEQVKWAKQLESHCPPGSPGRGSGQKSPN